jgi:invasion protein IalB
MVRGYLLESCVITTTYTEGNDSGVNAGKAPKLRFAICFCNRAVVIATIDQALFSMLR